MRPGGDGQGPPQDPLGYEKKNSFMGDVEGILDALGIDGSNEPPLSPSPANGLTFEALDKNADGVLSREESHPAIPLTL